MREGEAALALLGLLRGLRLALELADDGADEAAEQAIAAVARLGQGTVTISDADVALTAPEAVTQVRFDEAAGRLEQALHLRRLEPPLLRWARGDREHGLVLNEQRLPCLRDRHRLERRGWRALEPRLEDERHRVCAGAGRRVIVKQLCVRKQARRRR